MKPKDISMDLRADIGPKSDSIRVTHLWDPVYIEKMKAQINAKWIPPEKGGPAWSFPLDLEVGIRLRANFGEQLTMSKRLHTWAKKKRDRKNKLIRLANTTTGDLPHLEELDRELYEAIYIGPRGIGMSDKERAIALKGEPSFQTADVAFMVEAERCMNANHPGTGKTLESIAAAVEAGLCDDGMKKLVIAPLTSLDTVWVPHLEQWQWNDIILGAGHKGQRDAAVAAAVEYATNCDAFWFVTNPQTLTYQAEYEYDEITGRRKYPPKSVWLKHPELHEIEWDLIIIDEYHQMGLTRPDSLTARSVFDIPVLDDTYLWWLSGTPIGGRPIKLFPPLHHFDPQQFDSKWKFGGMWMDITEGHGGGRVIGDVKEEERERFDEFISQYMVRRTKSDVAPWLPDKQHVEVWCEMTPAQSKQYKQFALETEIKIDDQQLSATSILAEYTRLKQFADSKCKIVPRPDKDGKPQPPRLIPLDDGGKLPQIERILTELGIIGEDAEDSDEQCVIFSQFTEMVKMVALWLETKHKIKVSMITGEVTRNERTQNWKDFQGDDKDRPRVMLINTKAGGVSITLDNASTVIILDETWNPDDQEQAEDRVHRVSRIHQVTVYTLITRGTIEDVIIQAKLKDKAQINKRILDIRRDFIKAAHGL